MFFLQKPLIATVVTSHACVLIARGQQDAVFEWIEKYPNVRKAALVECAVEHGGVEAGLRMMNDLERALRRGVPLEAAFPVILCYYKVRMVVWRCCHTRLRFVGQSRCASASYF